jgi:hypothetical protein
MKEHYLQTLVGLTLLSCLVGCGGATEARDAASAVPTNVDGAQFLLSEEPEGAVGVVAALESVEDGMPLVLVGRVGGAANPWVDGRAAFMVLDPSVTVVAEGEEKDEGEVCMGDCCATERLEFTTLVKVIDAEGRLVPVDARQLLGLKESDLVVLEGHAEKKSDKGFVMLASRVYIRR